MKVSVFGTRGFPKIQGGVEKHCECLYPILARNISINIYRRVSYVKSHKQYDNITFIDLPSTTLKGFETFWHSFLATFHILLFQHATQIVHIHNIGPGSFSPLLRLFGKRIVLTYHSANYEHKKWNFIERLILKLSEVISLKCAHAIIFVNKFQMEKFSNKIKNKSYYIPNGIEMPIESDKTDGLKKWDLENSKFILSVGRITNEKGFDILIDAFMGIHTDYKLVIVGSVESEKKYFRKLVSKVDNKRIIFTGSVYGDELFQLYQNASLYVLPSRNEGFPLVLLEAMSYHLPVIVSDIPATHLVDLPKNCYFCPEQVESLRSLLKEKLSHNLQKITYDMEEFNWENIATKTLDVYNKIIHS